MPDTETPTAATPPAPTEVVEAPTTETPPANEQVVEPPAEEPKPEAEPETAKPEEPEPPDPYDELEHERFKPVLERRDRRVEEGIRADYQAQYDTAERELKSGQTHKQVAGAYGAIVEKLGEGDLEGAEKLLSRLSVLTEPYEKDLIKAQKKEGADEAAQQLYGAVRGSLDPRGQDELQDYLTVNRNAGWGDILKKRDEIREGKANKSSSDEVTALKAQIEDLKAKARPDGPDTTPKPGSVGDDNKRLLDPTTPIAEIMEIRDRQKAAGE